MSYVYEKTVVCVRCRSVTYLMNDQKVSPEQRKVYLCETCNEEANEGKPVAETTPLPCSRPLTPVTPMINDRSNLSLPRPPKSVKTSESTVPESSSSKSSSSSSFCSKVSRKLFSKRSDRKPGSNSSKSGSMSSISDFVQRLKEEFRSSSSSNSSSKRSSKSGSSKASSSTSNTSSSDFQSRQKREIPVDFQDEVQQPKTDEKIIPEPIEIENSNLTEVCEYDGMPIGETHWPEPTEIEIPEMWPDTPRPIGPNQFLAPNAGLRARCGCMHPTLDAEGLKQLELQNQKKEIKMEMQKELQEQVPCQMMGSGMMVNRNRMMVPGQIRGRMVGNLMVGSPVNYPCMMPAFYAGGSGNRASPANSFHGPYTYSNPVSAVPQINKTPAFLSRNSSVNHFLRPQLQPLANCQNVGSSPILFQTQNSCKCHTSTTNLCTARRFSDKSVPSNYYSNHKPLQQTFYEQPRSYCMAHTMQTALKNGCVLHGGMIAGKVIKNSAEN